MLLWKGNFNLRLPGSLLSVHGDQALMSLIYMRLMNLHRDLVGTMTLTLPYPNYGHGKIEAMPADFV